MATGIPHFDDDAYTKDKIYRKPGRCSRPSCFSSSSVTCAGCNRDFCVIHQTHTHYICAYCDKLLATTDILIDDQLACPPCTKQLSITRTCTRCAYWQPKNATFCAVCADVDRRLIKRDWERTQRACFAQRISGAYGYFK